MGTLLLNVDTVTRRIYAFTYILSSLGELNRVFALPKHDTFGTGVNTHLPDPSLCGVHLTCKEVSFAYPHSPPLFEQITVEAAPGETLAVLEQSNTQKSTLALVLVGLYLPTSDVVRYNNVDLLDVPMDYVNRARGLVLDAQSTLLKVRWKRK